MKNMKNAVNQGLLGDMQEQLGRLDSEVGILQELHHERIVNLQGFHKLSSCKQFCHTFPMVPLELKSS